MSIGPWNPKRDIDLMGKEFDRIFDWSPFRFFGGATSPRVDVFQTDTEVVVKAEIPGVSKEDLDVYIEEDSLRLSGQTTKDNEFRDEHAYRTERHYGSFSRVIPLPVEVKSDLAKAEYKNGILAVRIPKSGQSRARGKKVDIN